MFLKCNNLKCRTEIQKLAMITNCSHIFCNQCYPKVKKTKTCTACKSYCDEGDSEIKELNIKPCLAGFSPEEIVECAQNGVSFWLYQVEQEFVIEKALKEKAVEEAFKAKHEAKSLAANYSIEMENKQQKIERLEQALERERQNSYELNVLLAEKNRQYQKLVVTSDRKKISLQNYGNCAIDQSHTLSSE